jgi:hypothetical protein
MSSCMLSVLSLYCMRCLDEGNNKVLSLVTASKSTTTPIHQPQINTHNMASRIPRTLPLRSAHRPTPSTLRLALQTRQASTSRSLPRRFLSTTVLLGTGTLLAAYYYDTRSLLHEHVVMPLIRLGVDAEQGHELAVKMLALPKMLRPRDMGEDGRELEAEVGCVACRMQSDSR